MPKRFRNSRRRPSKRPRLGPSKPPSFRPSFGQVIRARYYAMNAFSSTVKYNQLAGYVGIAMTGTTPGALAYVFTSVRVISIEVWAGLGSYPTSVMVNWPTGDTNQSYIGSGDLTISDSSVTPQQPAHIKTTVPKGTLQSMWHFVEDPAAFALLQVPAGAVIDVVFEYRVDANPPGSPVYLATSTGSLTVGVLYHASLDGSGTLQALGVINFCD